MSYERRHLPIGALNSLDQTIGGDWTFTGDVDFSASGTFKDLNVISYRDSSVTHVRLVGWAARGTSALPAALQTGDEIMSLQPVAHNGTSFQGAGSYRWSAFYDAGTATVSWGTDSDVNLGGALTATSYGGIAEANLLDKTAAETITGEYTFDGSVAIGAGFVVGDSASTGITLEIRTAAGNDSLIKFREANDNFGANLFYDGDSNLFRLTMVDIGVFRNVFSAQRSTGDIQFHADILNSDGSAASPSYSFSSDPDTGMYRPASNVIGFSTAGALRARLYASFLRVENGTTLAIEEKAAANSDLANHGQLWVRASDKALMYTSDSGVDRVVQTA